MADRSGKMVPGQVYIEVEYDYEYEAKDRKIVIKQGERYVLVKKTNDDWWQVKPDENSKAFYVPAQYVKEVTLKALMPPIKQAVGLPNNSMKRMQSLHLQRSTENVNKLPELSSLGKPSWSVQGTGLIQFLDIEKTSFSQEQSCDSAGEGSERIHQDSEFGDELSSSSTEQIRATTPPNPGSPAIQINGEWETHKDSSGRCYYYNRGTQERTWKPPRWTWDANISKAFQSPGDQELLSSEENYHSTCYSQSDSQCGSPPRGWSEELDERGHTSYTSDYTNEKWLKHVDDQGRQYYYSADGSRSEWELAKYNPSAQQKREIIKILQGSSLLFTKTQGSSTSWFGSNQPKPEFTVDLRGATIEMASKDKSSKKNVFELKTRQGTELLIQSDNDAVINDWFKVLSSTISNQAVETDERIEEEVPDSPVIEKPDKEKDQKDLKKLRSMKVSSIDSSDRKKKKKKKKTKKNLKKFLTRLPTLQAVREKGYIKDQVFGSNLANLCQRENGTVPKFVNLCIEHVEEHGLDVDGIYRVSGNLAVVQKLRFAVNHDEKLDLNDSKWEDIHVITGALKMFFRELPEPLFTFNHFNDFVNAIKQEPRQRVAAVKDLIRQLPKPNQDTMQILFRHLKRVIENGEKNRMTYQSIAIVFGPTLLKPEKETGNTAVNTVYQNQIVELILLELNSIFGR
ncbi:Hypothetical predicted protein [Marmota monax]|uniref:Rho GTPase-activating protein 12 n=1 Tax=Marmota monax TaxID=9995 RepID=A0A5E4CV54_MARMO|nr:Hypothetical predicted protein [Marmota monax]